MLIVLKRRQSLGVFLILLELAKDSASLELFTVTFVAGNSFQATYTSTMAVNMKYASIVVVM